MEQDHRTVTTARFVAAKRASIFTRRRASGLLRGSAKTAIHLAHWASSRDRACAVASSAGRT
jgi:hypothetical protein